MKEEDAQLLVLAAEMDKAGIDKVKKSVEQVGEKVDEVKRGVERLGEPWRRWTRGWVKSGVGGLDKRLLAVLEAPEGVN